MLAFAAAYKRTDLGIQALADAIGISRAHCWDLLEQEDELSTLSLSQWLRAAATLHVQPLNLLSEPVQWTGRYRSFEELADKIRMFCKERDLSEEQFGDLAGWDVREFVALPSRALDGWNLDCLRDVCAALGLSWPEYLPETL